MQGIPPSLSLSSNSSDFQQQEAMYFERPASQGGAENEYSAFIPPKSEIRQATPPSATSPRYDHSYHSHNNRPFMRSQPQPFTSQVTRRVSQPAHTYNHPRYQQHPMHNSDISYKHYHHYNQRQSGGSPHFSPNPPPSTFYGQGISPNPNYAHPSNRHGDFNESSYHLQPCCNEYDSSKYDYHHPNGHCSQNSMPSATHGEGDEGRYEQLYSDNQYSEDHDDESVAHPLLQGYNPDMDGCIDSSKRKNGIHVITRTPPASVVKDITNAPNIPKAAYEVDFDDENVAHPLLRGYNPDMDGCTNSSKRKNGIHVITHTPPASVMLKDITNAPNMPKAAYEVDFDVLQPPSTPSTKPSKEALCTSTEEINDNDVLLGRGGGNNGRIGNRKFRALVQEFQPVYLTLIRKVKPLLSRSIVLIVRERGGRFLKQDNKSGELFEVGDEVATAKASQCLREGMEVREVTKRIRETSIQQRNEENEGKKKIKYSPPEEEQKFGSEHSRQYEDPFESHAPSNNSDTPSTTIAFSSTAVEEYSRQQQLLPVAVSSDEHDHHEGSALYKEDHGEVHIIPF